jgi:hypothetical protein
MISESLFQRALEIRLNAPERATRVRRQNSGKALVSNDDGSKRIFRGAPKGFGDLVGYVAPDGLYLECEAKESETAYRKKSPTNTRQRARGEAVRAAGGVYVTVWPESEDLDEAVELAVQKIDRAIEATRARRR